MNTQKEIQEIRGFQFLSAFQEGANRVISERKHLDDINIFPVPDGDTGTNLASTMASILPGRIELGNSANCALSSQTIADTILLGARGNSGAILTQFFQGLAEGLRDLENANLKNFAKACTTGMNWAYDAVAQPVEGTILSVMKAWANSLSHSADNDSKFEIALENGLVALGSSLEKTKAQMLKLKGSEIVDAGAKGFYLLVEGFTEFLLSGKSAKPNLQKKVAVDLTTKHDVQFDEEKFRYCTECVISGSDLSPKKLRENLGELGDSVVVAGSKNTIRLHIHTDDPEKVFQKARSLGEIIQEKVDDMRMQFLHRHKKKQRTVGIVVDSGCDLSEELMEKCLLHSVPFRVQFGSSGFIDKITLSLSSFYERLKNSPDHPTTSQPIAIDFKRAYDVVTKEYDEILSIHVPFNLSGTAQAAENAAKNFDSPIEIFDSNSFSVGVGLLARSAAEFADEGDDMSTIVGKLTKLRDEADVYCALDTMEYLVRGGRVSKIKGTFGKLLKLKPILSMTDDGHLKPSGTVRTQKKVLDKLVELIKEACQGRDEVRLAIAHADDIDRAKQLKGMLEKSITAKDIIISGISPAIGVHAGPKAIGVAVIG